MNDGRVMVTVSRVRNRVYARKFPHEEARARYGRGESIAALARDYGVSTDGVRRVVVPAVGAALRARAKRLLMTGTCIDCGKPGIARTSERCRPCAEAARRTSVRPDALRCSRCLRWLPDEEFPSDQRGKHRRGRRHHCRKCETEARRNYRNRHKVPCPHCGRLTSNAESGDRRTPTGLCLRCAALLLRREDGMPVEPTFIVLAEEEDGLWRELGRVAAKDKRDALSAVLGGEKPPEGDVCVISLQAFRPGRVIPVQVYDIET